MTVVEENNIEVLKPKKWLGVRHVQLLMVFLGMLLAQCTRTIMSVAIVDMTDRNNEKYFDWTIQRQSIVLSSFTWGYIVLQLFSGELDKKFGGMNLLIMSVGFSSVLSLLLPAAATYGGWIMVCVCRGVQGLIQGTFFPTVSYLLTKWVPLSERGRMTGFILSGAYMGIAVQSIASGYIANYWGWPMIFYVNGVAAIVWTTVYWFIGSDNPQVSKSISTEERLYIQSSLGQIGGHKKMMWPHLTKTMETGLMNSVLASPLSEDAKILCKLVSLGVKENLKLKTPWKSILTSLPFYAATATHVGYSWGYWTLLTEIPTYMSKVLQVNIRANGVMSALPYITIFLMNFPVGYTSDYIIKKQWLSLTACRKIFNSIGYFGAAACLYCLTYVPTGNVTIAVAMICLALGFKSGYYSGFIVSFLDMAQNFSSTLVALSNLTANFIGLFGPIFAGFVVKDENDPKEWHIVFYVSAAVYIVTNIIFVLFGTCEEQKWNKGTDNQTK